jgi:hypothetical protein
MTHQQRWQMYPSNVSTSERSSNPNMQGNDSATFVKPRFEGSAQPFTPYTYTEGDIPPPPPYLYQQLPHQPKRKRGYVIAIVLLTLLVVGLGSLEVIQETGWNLLAHKTNGSSGSNQPSLTSALRASESQRQTQVLTLTPGTIKENKTLACGACDDPIVTTIDSITINTTNVRLVWIVKLNNVSGSEQVDIFHDFNLQDPIGNIYEGTGKLNTVFILSAGQAMLATEIFSFLPRPDVPYTLIARLGVSGIIFDSVQFTF